MKLIILAEHTTETDTVNVNGQATLMLRDDNVQNKDENAVASEDNVSINESNIQSTESSQSNCSNGVTNEPEMYTDSIKIRLKYLNDDCRLVDGRLHEKVGVFKRYYYAYSIIYNY